MTPHSSGCAVGVAQWEQAETAQELLSRADVALYADKGSQLRRPARLRAVAAALAEPGATALDALVGAVAELLEVPVVLVSLVDDSGQRFPGMCGLPEPWATERGTPLTHSFCQNVVASSAPLVVTDAREDPRVWDNPAIRDLDVVAYAGVPLVDDGGHTLGSLCAIDSRPRSWTPDDLAVLSGLVAAVMRELRAEPTARPAAV